MNRREFSKLSGLALSGMALINAATPQRAAAAGGEGHETLHGSEPLRPTLANAYRQYCFDFNWVDKLVDHVKPLSDYANIRAQRQIQDLLEIDADALQVFCMSISGYMFYDSKAGTRHPSLQFDYTREMIRLGHEKGLAMELYVPTMWADYLIHQHPDWGIRNPDGTLFTAFFGGYNPDLNSPALDWYIEVIRELIPSYGADGFFADGITFLKYGQSQYTVEKFKQDMQRDYPASLENDPDWRATFRWEIKQIDHIWQSLRNAVKERDARVEVTFNGPGPNIAMPGRIEIGSFVPEPPHLNPHTDYVFTEAGSAGEYADWTRGISHPRPFRVTFNNSFSVLDPFDPNEMRARVGRALAIGGMPYRYDRTSVNGEPDRYFLDHWGAIFKEVQEKMPYVEGAHPLKYVGVVSSEPTMFYRGRSDQSCHADDMLGALKMLDALHIQHDVIADWNLKPGFLEPYAMIVLANTGCMSDGQVAAVRHYVEAGGTLIATAESSLFDESGNPRNDFALGDVLGVRIDETPSNAIQTGDNKKPVYINPAGSSHPILHSLPGTALILPGDSTYVCATHGKPTAVLIEDAGAVANSPGRASHRAALQVSAFGKGKCVYICGSIFARSSWQMGQDGGVRWAGYFVNAMVHDLAPNAPWKLRGSEKLWAGVNSQPAQRRHVLHLVNWATDLAACDVEVSIATATGAGPRATKVWPVRQPLRVERSGEFQVIMVPEVGPHVIVVFE